MEARVKDALENKDPLSPESPVWQTLELHPTYAEAFSRTHNELMRGTGPLRYEERHYIAMMASSRFRCYDLIEHHRRELLNHLGVSRGKNLDAPELQWIRPGGMSKLSPRLRRLDKVNKLLAHRPWMLQMETIRELIQPSKEQNDETTPELPKPRSPSSSPRLSQLPRVEDKWSLSELNQAVILLAHFHAFSAFVLGCGSLDRAKREPKADGGHAETRPDEKRAGSTEMAINDEEEAAETTASPKEASVEKEDSKTSGDGEVTSTIRIMETLSARNEEIETAELARRFEHVEVNVDGTRKKSALEKNGLILYSGDLEFQYEDFVKRANAADYPTLRILDYNWTDHVYNTVQLLYGQEIAQLLDDKFRTINSLTYMSIGRYPRTVDTTLFRRAIRNYVQCLYGIRHDDYDYAQVNELLQRPLKKYIKTLCCFSDRCEAEDYNSIMPDFLESEKVHVCMLVCEARLQACLIYAGRAIQLHYAYSR